MAVDPKPGERILDMCSAPGGKAFTMAQMMENKGEILALDLHQQRVSLIQKGAKHLGIKIIKAITADARQSDISDIEFDRVLCDVPCSGLGVISKKPEIRYKNIKDFEKLPEIQYSILSNGARYVKNGGRLVYSTCTLSKAENEEVAFKFLKEHKDFKGVPVLPYIRAFQFTFFPYVDNTDGFFIAVFEKVE